MSTTNHISHCSAYLRASIQRPTIDNDVVKASATGTVESVNVTSNHHRNHHNRAAAIPKSPQANIGVWVICRLCESAVFSRSREDFREVVFPVHDTNP